MWLLLQYPLQVPNTSHCTSWCLHSVPAEANVCVVVGPTCAADALLSCFSADAEDIMCMHCVHAERCMTWAGMASLKHMGMGMGVMGPMITRHPSLSTHRSRMPCQVPSSLSSCHTTCHDVLGLVVCCCPLQALLAASQTGIPCA